MTYDLHPLCTLFPRMNDAEFAVLRNDIGVNGLRQAITLHDGMILDGGNRYRACLEAGIKPSFVKFSGPSIGDFVRSANLHRRHLTTSQQAAIVATIQDWSKAQNHGGERSSAHVSTCSDTTKSRAEKSGASISTQRRADAVAKAKPELAREVAQGIKSLAAAVKEVAPQLAPRTVPVVTSPASHDSELLELVDDLQAENTRLTALITVSEADDLKTEAIKWKSAYDRSLAAQSEAMNAAHRSEKREKFTKKQLMRCGKAVGCDDPTKIASAVEAMAKAAKPCK